MLCIPNSSWPLKKAFWQTLLLGMICGIALLLVVRTTSVLQGEELIPKQWRTYSEGPLRRAEFQETRPDNPTEQEAQHEAMIYGDLNFDYKYRTMNGVGQVTLVPTSIRIWAVMDVQKSWFLADALQPESLLDHEQGHFDIFEIAARQLQLDFEKQIAAEKLQFKGRTEKEALTKFKESLQKHVTETGRYIKQVSLEYDNLCVHGLKVAEQSELRKVHRRHLQQLSAARKSPTP